MELLLLLTLWLENPAGLGERTKMVVVASLQEGKSQLLARISGLVGHFRYPLLPVCGLVILMAAS